MAKPQNTAYATLLRDPRWQKRRLEIMQRDQFSCCDCGAVDKTLNVHHVYYRQGFAPWDYPASALRTVCEDCHQIRSKSKSDNPYEMAKSIVSELLDNNVEPDEIVHLFICHYEVMNGRKKSVDDIREHYHSWGFIQ